MSEQSFLRRKIGSPRGEDTPQPLTPARVWQRAVTHGLMRSIGLEATIGDVQPDRIMPDAVSDRIKPGDMVALLDGPAGYGIAIVSSGLLAAMLEIQTMGSVQKRALHERDVTPLDAAMIADPLDGILTAHQALVGDMPGQGQSCGYRYATHVENLREIVLTLEDDLHDIVTIAIEAGPGGPRSGQIEFILLRHRAARAGQDRNAAWSSSIEQRLMGAEVTLTAELTRLTLPVRALQALKVGDQIPLSRHAIGDVALVAAGGQTMCKGRLGQSAGRKAVRMGAASHDFSVAQVAAAHPAPDA